MRFRLRIIWPLFLATVLTATADGYLLLSNLDDVVDAPVTIMGRPPGPNCRAWLVLADSNVDLQPYTNFRHDKGFEGYLNPVVVKVPGKNPGDRVDIKMKAIQSLNFGFGESRIFSVTLGTETEPAKLVGLTSFNLPWPSGSGLINLFFGFIFDEEIIRPVFEPLPLSLTGLVLDRPGGSLFASGNFTKINAEPMAKVACFSIKGSLDPVFKSPLTDTDEVDVLMLQNDGKLLVGGKFHLPGDSLKPSLLRLLRTGDIDPAFNVTIEMGPVTALAQLASGEILVAHGTNVAKVSRLKVDGANDDSFSVEATRVGGAQIEAIEPEDSGAFYLAGNFSEVRGISRDRFCRLLPRGILDINYPSQTLPFSGTPTDMERDGITTIRFSENASIEVPPGERSHLIATSENKNGDLLRMGEYWLEVREGRLLLPKRSWLSTDFFETDIACGTATHLFYGGPSYIGRAGIVLGRGVHFLKPTFYKDAIFLNYVAELNPWDPTGTNILTFEIETSVDLVNWDILPTGIRDTNFVNGPKFYRASNVRRWEN